MEIKDFIQKNKEMWKDFQNNETKEKLLVEAPNDVYFFVTHSMAMQTLILNNAKGYQPLWIRNKNVPVELLKSYVPSAEYIDLEPLTKFDNWFSKIYASVNYLKMLVTGNTLDFYFKGIKYGDVLHDMYLVMYQQGTLQKPNKHLRQIMRMIINTHIQYEKTIKKYKINAILASQRVGINPSCLVRSALRKNLNAYTTAGNHRCTLHLSDRKSQIIEYEYSPTKEQIQQILDLPDELFNKYYDEIRNSHLNGKINGDTKLAYSDTNILYKNKKDFCEKYGLDENKKNVFIMLHAFNDYPHSHFKGMLFKDYGDWFFKTLEFAKKHDNVNWIFKQHPSDKFYPTKDINLPDIFKNIKNKNITLLTTEDKIDTRSLEYIADAILTCLGSAGFEMPAFYGIPAILAGDSYYYTGHTFVKKPKTKTEYFKVLKNIHKFEKISPLAQKEAKAVYMFIYKYCTVDYKFNTFLEHDDYHDPNYSKIFFDKVAELYNEHYEECQNEIARYAFEVSRHDFKALRTKNFIKYEDYFCFPFDVTKPMPECKIDIMKEGCQILKDLNIPYCLADGTLLGVYRDKKLIPHDTDIDISVVLPVNVDSIIRKFTKHGFKIGRLPVAYGQVQQVVFYKNETLFDIIFYQKVGDKVLNFCEKDFYFMHDAHHYENYDKVEFEGFEFSIPQDVEGWLAHTYGDDWKFPKPKPANWRMENSYLGAFHYDGDSYKVIKEFENK